MDVAVGAGEAGGTPLEGSEPVYTAYVTVTVVAIVAHAGIAVADLLRAPFVLANSAEVGVPASWLPWLAGLKGAGAAGLLVGLLGVRPLGVAAAAGLVLFFVGAVAAHLRARVFHNIAFPLGYLALGTAALVVGAAA
ncbi:DoxX family protein [Streptomyces coelicoflavus]|uniref:DoxX family protein n=1 Tax=Streptomyces coelicoflavus TaxID=285562 RepID=A0A7K3PG48_9ACTN|nr:DoxX family protein [Streptomyces coelicoflavus]NEB08331.1 DoxX family protein [Streptomyces coelicoflavus]